MDHLEMVEKLRAHADVGYEEARAALEETEWDLLDAVVLLERQGKTRPGGASYTTREKPREEERPCGRRRDCHHHADRFFAWLGDLFTKGSRNMLEVSRGGSVVMTIPVLVFVLLLVLAFWIVIPLLIIGLFCGCRFALRGPEVEREEVNRVIGKASDMAEDIKQEFTRETRESKE